MTSMKSDPAITLSVSTNSGTHQMVKPEKSPDLQPTEGTSNAASVSKAVENIFERALRAKSERTASVTTRVTKSPSRIRPTTKVKGWFCSHPDVIIGPIDVFYPKDEGGFTDEPTFIWPDLAAELRAEGSQFENSIKEMTGYLVYTMGGALCLVLVPVADATTGRRHSANEQKIDALEQARSEWKRLDWNQEERQYDDWTAKEINAEPKWPDDVSPASILSRAFGERNVIKDRDDPLLVKFRGGA